MARLVPVPKFGDWDSKPQSFTLIFDNVRAEKVGRVLTPNDPEFFSSSPARLNEEQRLQDDKVGRVKIQTCLSDHKVQSAPSSPLAPANPVKARKQIDDEYIDYFPAPVYPESRANEDEGRAEVLPQRNYKTGQVIDCSAFEYSGDHLINGNDVKIPGNGTQLERYVNGLDVENGSNAYRLAGGRTELDNGMRDIKRPPPSPLHHQAYQGRLGIKATTASSPRKMPVQAKAAAGKFQGNSRADEMPAELPILDGKRPGAADSYTAIFNQLREEKSSSHASSLHLGRRPPIKLATPPLKSTSKWSLCCSAPFVKQ